jgi:hypothetical protein
LKKTVSKLNFSVILLCCGMASIVINALIFVAATKNRNEYELIQNENAEEILQPDLADSTAVEERSEQTTTIGNEL